MSVKTGQDWLRQMWTESRQNAGCLILLAKKNYPACILCPSGYKRGETFTIISSTIGKSTVIANMLYAFPLRTIFKVTFNNKTSSYIHCCASKIQMHNRCANLNLRSTAGDFKARTSHEIFVRTCV